MAEAIDVAFVELRPDITGFHRQAELEVKAALAGVNANVPLGVRGAGLTAANRELKGVKRNANEATQAATLFGGTAARAGQIAAVGFLGAGVAAALAVKHVADASIDFETAFSGVRKTVNATQAQLGVLRKGFLDLSTQIPVSASDLAKIGEAAGQLGIKTSAILKFTKTVAELGVTTDLTSDQAADDLARIANITGLPQQQFDRLGSTIVALGNNLAATESEIADFTLRIAGAGKTVGLTVPEIAGLGAALASVGLRAEAGGTAISTTLVKIASAVASGGDKLEAFAKVAGESADDFAEQFRTKPGEAILAFVKGLGQVRASGQNVFQVLQDLGLGNIRTRDTLLRAANAGDLLSRALDLAGKSFQKNTALQREANIRFGTTASKIQLLNDTINTVSIAIGDKFGPSIGKAADALTGFIKGLRENEQITSSIQSGAAALGRIFSEVFAVFKQNRNTIRDTFADLGSAIRTILVTVKPFVALIAVQLIVGLKAAIIGIRVFAAALKVTAEIVARTERVVLGFIDKFLAGLTVLVDAASHIPGVGGKFAGVSDKINAARETLRGFSDDLKNLNGTTVDVSVGLTLRPDEGTRGPGAPKIKPPKPPPTPPAAPPSTDSTLKKIPDAIKARESQLQAIVETAQSTARSSDDRTAISALKALYDRQAANLELIPKIRAEFAKKAAAAGAEIAQIDNAIVENAQADRESQAQDAIAAADATEGTLRDDISTRRKLIGVLEKRVVLARQNEQGVGAAIAAVNAAQRDLVAKLREQQTHRVDLKVTAAQTRVTIADSTEKNLKDDVATRKRLVAVLKQRVAVVRATKGDVQSAANDLRAAERDLKDTLKTTAQERADAILDAINDQKEIASFTKATSDDRKALLREKRFWQNRIKALAAGSVERRKAKVQLERTKHDLAELKKDAKVDSDVVGGTSLADLFNRAQEIARGAGIGKGAGLTGQQIDLPISQEVQARLSQMDVTASLREQAPTQAERDQLDSQRSLTAALDRLTAAVSGNAAATGQVSGGGTHQADTVQSQDRRFWRAVQAKQIAEARHNI